MDGVDERLRATLSTNNYGNCPRCDKEVDRGDVAWNEGNTEAGTPFTIIEIQCQRCDTEVLYFTDWYPWCDDLEEVVRILEEELAPKPGPERQYPLGR